MRKESKLTARLRANRIFNDWGLVGPGGWILTYTAYDGAGFGAHSGWHLTCVESRINDHPERPWYEGKDSLSVPDTTFLKLKDGTEPALKFARERTEIQEWVKSPFGRCSWIPADTLKEVIEGLK